MGFQGFSESAREWEGRRGREGVRCGVHVIVSLCMWEVGLASEWPNFGHVGLKCVGWQFYASNSIERALHVCRRPLVSSEILGHRLQDLLLPFSQRFTSGGVMLCLNTSNMGKLEVFFIWGSCHFVGFSQISTSWKQQGLELVGLGGDFFFSF